MSSYIEHKLSQEQIELIKEFQESLPGKPVNIVGLAQKFGCSVYRTEMPVGISGAIIYEEDKFNIYLNETEVMTRRRFTCAHELGHYLLHGGDIRNSPLHENVMLRSNLSNDKEVEANKVAADLLMPMEMVNHIAETQRCGVSELAATFGVSRQAMLVRLGIPEYSSS